MVDDNSKDVMQKAQEEARANAITISNAAKKIFNLIPPGTTLRVDWEIQPEIISPGTKTKKQTLIITKPAVDLCMTFRVK